MATDTCHFQEIPVEQAPQEIQYLVFIDKAATWAYQHYRTFPAQTKACDLVMAHYSFYVARDEGKPPSWENVKAELSNVPTQRESDPSRLKSSEEKKVVLNLKLRAMIARLFSLADSTKQISQLYKELKTMVESPP